MRFSSMQQIRLYNTMRKARYYQKQFEQVEQEAIAESSPRVSTESQAATLINSSSEEETTDNESQNGDASWYLNYKITNV